ncbi:MAG: tRNA (adenosine(37)-N6)-threonylcarbamoyltransferase complex ATPase subunit type 1 TsaE, partial [Gemmatimonadota bacterium]
MSLTEAQLEAWGERVGASLRAPAFIALRGDLGAGKSVLARAIARGAGVTAAMPSPTFNLVFRYAAGAVDVVHLDLYRLEREDEVWELGWRELGAAAEIVLVEWPERAESLLPEDRWDVHIGTTEPHLRTVMLQAYGSPPPLPPLPAGASQEP